MYYGEHRTVMRLENRYYSARLIIADVGRPLLGADFLRQHNLLVDIHGHRVIEAYSYHATNYSINLIDTSPTELSSIDPASNKFSHVLLSRGKT